MNNTTGSKQTYFKREIIKNLKLTLAVALIRLKPKRLNVEDFVNIMKLRFLGSLVNVSRNVPEMRQLGLGTQQHLVLKRIAIDEDLRCPFSIPSPCGRASDDYSLMLYSSNDRGRPWHLPVVHNVEFLTSLSQILIRDFTSGQLNLVFNEKQFKTIEESVQTFLQSIIIGKSIPPLETDWQLETYGKLLSIAAIPSLDRNITKMILNKCFTFSEHILTVSVDNCDQLSLNAKETCSKIISMHGLSENAAFDASILLIEKLKSCYERLILTLGEEPNPFLHDTTIYLLSSLDKVLNPRIKDENEFIFDQLCDSVFKKKLLCVINLMNDELILINFKLLHLASPFIS